LTYRCPKSFRISILREVESLHFLFMADGTHSEISRKGFKAPYKGPADYFTGDVTVAPVFPPNGTSNITGAYVAFAPKARTFWHIHPAGQHLVVISGKAWTKAVDGRKEEASPGDAIWCPANVKHWHGASPDGEMTHLALTLVKDGKLVEWLEPVTDEEYQAT
jgi:quercetin dioxygenase-like cupin family protein